MWNLCSRTTGGRCFRASHLTLHFIPWKLWVASALSPKEVGRTGMAEVLCICSSSQNNYARMRQGWRELKMSQKLWKSWLANIHIKKEKNKTKTKHLRPRQWRKVTVILSLWAFHSQLDLFQSLTVNAVNLSDWPNINMIMQTGGKLKTNLSPLSRD